MRYLVVFAFTAVSFSCSNPQGVVEARRYVREIKHSSYLAKDVFYDRLTSRWLHKSDSFGISGIIVSYFNSGIISKIINVSNGRKEGVQLTYYPNGKTKFYEMFANGRLEGTVKRWSIQNGYRLMSELTYSKGKLHGEQKKWYSSGELHKVLNMEMGKEVGLQRAYRKNGALYANYEAKNGRTFGMKRSNLCYELQDEEIVYQQ